MENMKELNLTEIFSALVRKIWLIILLAVIAGALAFGYTKNFVTPMYRSGVTIYVNNRVTSRDDGSVSAADLATSQRLVATYIQILSSDTVLQKVAEAVKTDHNIQISAAGIRGRMTAGAKDNTEVFDVYISDADPKKAAIIANAIAEIAPGEIGYFVEGSSTKIVDYAKVASAPYTPNTSRNTTFGMVGGAFVAVIIVVLQTLLDVRIKGEEDLAAISSAPVLGMIPDLAMESSDEYGYKSGYKKTYRAQPYKSKNGEADV